MPTIPNEVCHQCPRVVSNNPTLMCQPAPVILINILLNISATTYYIRMFSCSFSTSSLSKNNLLYCIRIKMKTVVLWGKRSHIFMKKCQPTPVSYTRGSKATRVLSIFLYYQCFCYQFVLQELVMDRFSKFKQLYQYFQ